MDTANFADLAPGDDGLGLPDGGQESGPHGLHEKHAVLCGTFLQLPGLAGVDADGLFAQHMLAGVQKQLGDLHVVGVGRGHIDRVYLLGSGHGFIAAKNMGDVILFGKGLCPLLAGGGYGGQFAAVQIFQSHSKLISDFSGTGNAPANLFHKSSPLK